MTNIQKIKNSGDYEYLMGCIFIKGQDMVSFDEADTQHMIEEYYEGREIEIPHWTGNPEKSYRKQVSGRRYLEENFPTTMGIDYKAAYKNIPNE